MPVIEPIFTKQEIKIAKVIANYNHISLEKLHHYALHLGFWSCDEGRSAWIKESIPLITNDPEEPIKNPIKLEEWEFISVVSYSHEYGVRQHEFVRAAIIKVIKITRFLDLWAFDTNQL